MSQLTDLEEECFIFQSLLNMKQPKSASNAYCVLTSKWLIVYKNKSDIISLKRIPLNKKTIIEYQKDENYFFVNINVFKFKFQSSDALLIQRWVKEMISCIKKNVFLEDTKECYSTEVTIDHICGGNRNIYILMKRNDYLLYIYDSFACYQHDIVTHVINFKFYTNENISSISQSKSIILRGPSDKFKITFKDESQTSRWKTIFSDAKNHAFIDKKSTILNDIYKFDGNKVCADCDNSDPQWVSVNLCIMICIDCAGHHRNLGVNYSRIHSATIDERIWGDSLLINLINQIGNVKSNSFWFKNKSRCLSSQDRLKFIRDKYVYRKFIDTEYVTLSVIELKNYLRSCVSKDDVFMTLRLWHSIDGKYEPEFIEELSTIARSFNQKLQEKFLSLQPIAANLEIQNSSDVIENFLQVSFNEKKKLDSLFIVSLNNNSISIQTSKLNNRLFEKNNICCIPFDNICVLLECDEHDRLLASIDPPVLISKFTDDNKSTGGCTYVNQISFFSPTKNILIDFRSECLKKLIPTNFIPFTTNTNLYMNLNVRIDKKIDCKCKCYLTGSELAIGSPIFTAHNLKQSYNLRKMDDNKTVCIVYEKYQIYLNTLTEENQKIIFYALEGVSKTMKLELKPIDDLVSFIESRGILTEGIFRITGNKRRINELLTQIEIDSENFHVDRSKYSIHDTTCCLKRYLSSLPESLITDNLFEIFLKASQLDKWDLKICMYFEAIDCLPHLNYAILRRVLGLLYLIQSMSKYNKMDSDCLAKSTALSIIYCDKHSYEVSISILKDLINNFIDLFQYSENEMKNLNAMIDFLHKRKTSDT